MEITLKNCELVSIDGKPFQGQDEKPMRLFDACSIALSTDLKEDEAASFADKCKRMDLAKLFVDCEDEVGVEAEVVADIEKRASKLFKSPLCWSIREAMKV